MSNANIKILNNTEYNGVEIYFDKIPTKQTITQLKANNFRWHTAKKCWYAKATEKATKFIDYLQGLKDITTEQASITRTSKNATKEENNTITLKSIRKATEKERKQIIEQEYPNDTHMQQFLAKQYEYYLTFDGYILEFEKASARSITKELWYDDEYDAPQVNLTNFIEENRHNGLQNQIEHAIKNQNIVNVRYALTHNHDEKHCFIYILTNWEYEEKQTYYKFFRDLTEDEKADYIAIMQSIQEQYIIRLTKYYNKYGHKITTHGYWANR